MNKSSLLQRLMGWIYKSKYRLLVISASIYILLNDNIYPGMVFIEERPSSSPYGLSFLERYKEASKNLLAENVLLVRGRNGLGSDALRQAAVAWRYFANNIDPHTSLVNSIDNYPVTSAWDTASLLAAMHSARRLGIIDKATFDQIIQPLFATFNSIKLLEDQVLNRYYNTASAKMVGYTNREGPVGYSPLDTGRLLGWLYVYKQHYPEYATDIDRLVLRWNFCNLIDGGEMFGGTVNRAGELLVSQRGRLGYEEYAAKGFYLWGFNTSQAARHEPLEQVEVAGQSIPIDQRDLVNPLEKSFVVPDSYMLDGLEFGWDAPNDFHTPREVHSDSFSYATASSIYHAQRLRFEATGLLTARSELQLPSAPWFVYDSIYANGNPWQTIDDLGRSLPSYAALSTRAVFSMWALWDTPYTSLLYQRVANFYDKNKGYYEGVFESGANIQSFSASTNATVLESIAYAAYGKSVVGADRIGLWEFSLASALDKRDNPKCYPIEMVCEKNCDQIASFNTHGIQAKKLREVESKLIKLENSREQLLKPFEIVQ